MKIERKIILSNAVNLGLILLIGVFALQNLNRVLTKLRFVEIADDLNASFLEMRLSEKNYILFHDEGTLTDMQAQISRTLQTIDSAKQDIVRAVGEENLSSLISHVDKYSGTIRDIQANGRQDAALKLRLRMHGKELKEFSESLVRIERARVNDIITSSKRVLFYSFWAIFLLAILVSHFVSQRILLSLRAIERLTRAIAEGKFHRIEGPVDDDEAGSVVTAINSMSDELRSREEELIQSKKLASLGILTAGVAHELTNPLNNISMIAQNYLELYDSLDREKRLEFMQQVDDETKRIGEIVRNLLDFSRPKDADLQAADINETIRKSLQIMQNSLHIANIDVKLSLDPLPPARFDVHQIQQVLVNLILNAIQAMQPGGALSITTGAARDRKTVRIYVRDTGSGIPPEFIPHIFDPFFSTKGVGGTGLGLSVSYGIIKNHGGAIRAESTVGRGTTFIIELPVYGKEET
ncbi:MAG: ATP-binding protein [Nitrospiraceae bacterium]|nr:ATP-binding protein [Nitrospiraceae bacterium]